jgi:hypothetical protein
MWGVIEVEEEVVTANEGSSTGSAGMGGSVKGFGFLDGLKVEEKDGELEEKIGSRKRKREEEVNEVGIGMYGVPGWRWRERETREEKRWKRAVVD